MTSTTEYKYSRIQPEVQTRSESSGLEHFGSIQEAYTAWEQDDSIWKISFSVLTENGERMCRFRPVTKKDLKKWGHLSIQKIKCLKPDFDALQDHTILWMDQKICDIDKMLCVMKSKILEETTELRLKLALKEEEEAKDIEKEKLEELYRRFPTEEDHEDWYYAELIQEVLSDEEFKKKYCIGPIELI